MACFVVTAAEAVVVTAAAQVVKHNERKKAAAVSHAEERIHEQNTIAWSRKLMWLAYLLWGGALLLAFEHVWHGEVVPFFPFLTAMNSAGDTAEMLHEMATVGTTMALIVTVVWGAIVGVAETIVRRSETAV